MGEKLAFGLMALAVVVFWLLVTVLSIAVPVVVVVWVLRAMDVL